MFHFIFFIKIIVNALVIYAFVIFKHRFKMSSTWMTVSSYLISSMKSICLCCLIIIIILSRNPLIWFGVWFVLKLHNFNEQLTSWLTTPTFWPLKVGWDGWWRGLVGWQQWHRLVRRQWCKDESSNTLPHSQHTGGELRRICDYSRQCSLFCRLHQNKAKC